MCMEKHGVMLGCEHAICKIIALCALKTLYLKHTHTFTKMAAKVTQAARLCFR